MKEGLVPATKSLVVLWGFLHGLAFFSVASGQSLCSWGPGSLFLEPNGGFCPFGLSSILYTQFLGIPQQNMTLWVPLPLHNNGQLCCTPCMLGAVHTQLMSISAPA